MYDTHVHDGSGAAGVCETEGMGTLRLKHVSKEYVTEGSSVPALHDVNVEFQAREHVALVGRSGRGKSTLLSLLVPWIFQRRESCGWMA